MKHGTSTGGRGGQRLRALLGLAALVTGVVLLVFASIFLATGGVADGVGERPAAGSGWNSAVDEPAAGGHASPQALAAGVGRDPRPVRIVIPAIEVNAAVIPLGLDPTGALEVPEDFSETGWWTGGARPGESGPAVIAGHVDSHTGPAVFSRLGELRRGDAIAVERADGSRVGFRVAGSERYPKGRFPTTKVYGPTAGPALRLITCSGTFDQTTGHYPRQHRRVCRSLTASGT